MNRTERRYKLDWPILLTYLALVSFGWVNIKSASSGMFEDPGVFFDLSMPFGKQLLFIGLALLLIFIIMFLETKFYERFSSVIYLLSIFSLLGLFLFGKTVSGATSWYAIGGLTIQPGEFAKMATALALAKHLTDIHTDLRNISSLLKTLLIISIPAFLILLQNDAGSSLVYLSFAFVLFREGLQKRLLFLAVWVFIVTLMTLKLGLIPSSIFFILLYGLILFRYLKKMRFKFLVLFIASLFTLAYMMTIKHVYTSKLPIHQKDRISLWLGLEKSADQINRMRKTYAYNLVESEKAIRSGGWTGKGYMQGTRTTGKFVPEQHTDYIFSTVGEEWGFLGSVGVIVLYVFLILRILYLAEAQKVPFARVYGYGVASILFFHFFVNIGMSMGLVPTIGIPLPFFSYGGSSLWSFTLLLFIFVKLDSNRINEW